MRFKKFLIVLLTTLICVGHFQVNSSKVKADDFNFVKQPSDVLYVKSGNSYTFEFEITGGTAPYTFIFKKQLSGVPDSVTLDTKQTSDTTYSYTVSSLPEEMFEGYYQLEVKDSSGEQLTLFWQGTIHDVTAYNFNYEFSSGGASGDVPESGIAVQGGTIITLPSQGALSYDINHLFVGWNCDGKIYKPGDTIMLDSDKTFTAQWDDNVPLTYDVSNGKFYITTWDTLEKKEIPTPYGITVSQDFKTITLNGFNYSFNELSHQIFDDQKIAALEIVNGDVTIELAENSTNEITIYTGSRDTTNHSLAAIKSSNKITIQGSGELVLSATNYTEGMKTHAIDAKQLIVSDTSSVIKATVFDAKSRIINSTIKPSLVDGVKVYGKRDENDGGEYYKVADLVLDDSNYVYKVNGMLAKHIIIKNKVNNQTECEFQSGVWSENKCTCPEGRAWTDSYGCREQYTLSYANEGLVSDPPTDSNKYFADGEKIQLIALEDEQIPATYFFIGWQYYDVSHNLQMVPEDGLDISKTYEYANNESTINLVARFISHDKTLTYDVSTGKFSTTDSQGTEFTIPRITGVTVDPDDKSHLTFDNFVYEGYNLPKTNPIGIKFINGDVKITLKDDTTNKINIYYEFAEESVETPSYGIYSENKITFDGNGSLELMADPKDDSYYKTTGIKAKQIVINNNPTIDVRGSVRAVETTDKLPEKSEDYYIYGKRSAELEPTYEKPVVEAKGVKDGDFYTYKIENEVARRILISEKHNKQKVCTYTGGTYDPDYSTCNCGDDGRTYIAETGCTKTYQIVYEGNGHDEGTPPEDNNNYIFNEKVTIKGNTGKMANSNSQFNGWYYYDDGGAKHYIKPGETLTIDETFGTEGGKIYLSANWVADKDIVYDANEGQFYYKDDDSELKPLCTPLGITINNDKSLTFEDLFLSTRNDISLKIINGDVTIHLQGENNVIRQNNSSGDVTLIDAGDNNITIVGSGNLTLDTNNMMSLYNLNGIKCKNLYLGDSNNEQSFTGKLEVYLYSDEDNREEGITSCGITAEQIEVYGSPTVKIYVADKAVSTNNAIAFIGSDGLNIHGSNSRYGHHYVLEFNGDENSYVLTDLAGEQKIACLLDIDDEYVVAFKHHNVETGEDYYSSSLHKKDAEATLDNNDGVEEGKHFFGWKDKDGEEIYAGSSKIKVTKNYLFEPVVESANFTLVYDRDLKQFYKNTSESENKIPTPAGITIDSNGNLKFDNFVFETNKPTAFKVIGSSATPLIINLKNTSTINLINNESTSEQFCIVDTLDNEQISIKLTGDGELNVYGDFENSALSFGIMTKDLIMDQTDFEGDLYVKVTNRSNINPLVGVWLEGVLTLSGGSFNILTNKLAIFAHNKTSFATKDMKINGWDESGNFDSVEVKEYGEDYGYTYYLKDSNTPAEDIECYKLNTNTVVFDTDQAKFVDNVTDKNPVDPPNGITIPTEGENLIELNDVYVNLYNTTSAFKVIGTQGKPLTIKINKKGNDDYHLIILNNTTSDIKDIVGINSDVDLNITGNGKLMVDVYNENPSNTAGSKTTATAIKLAENKTLTFDENFTGFVKFMGGNLEDSNIANYDGLGATLSNLVINSSTGYVNFNGSKNAGEFGEVTLKEGLKTAGNNCKDCFKVELDKLAEFNSSSHTYKVLDDDGETSMDARVLCMGPLYQVKYEKNGEEELGDLPPASNYQYPGENTAYNIERCSLYKENYGQSFINWVDANDHKYLPEKTIEQLTEDIVLKPVWINNDFTIVYDASKGVAYKNEIGGDEIPLPNGVYPIDGQRPNHISLNGFKFKTTAPIAFKFVNDDLTIILKEGSENIVETTTDVSKTAEKSFAAITDDGNNRILTIEGSGKISAKIKTTGEEQPLKVAGIKVGAFKTSYDGESNIEISALATNKYDSSYFGVWTYGKDKDGNSFVVESGNTMFIQAKDNAVNLNITPVIDDGLSILGSTDIEDDISNLKAASMNQKATPYYYDIDGIVTKTLAFTSQEQKRNFIILYVAEQGEEGSRTEDGNFYYYTDKDKTTGLPIDPQPIPNEALAVSGLSRDGNDVYKIKLDGVDFSTTGGGGLELYSSDFTKPFTVEIVNKNKISVDSTTLKSFELTAGIGSYNSINFIGDGSLTIENEAETSDVVVGIGSQAGEITFGSNNNEDSFTGKIEVYADAGKNLGLGIYGKAGLNVYGTGSVIASGSDMAIQTSDKEPIVDEDIDVNGIYEDIRQFAPVIVYHYQEQTPYFYTYVLPSYEELATTVAFGEIPETVNDYTLVYMPVNLMTGASGFYYATDDVESFDDLEEYDGVPKGITIDSDNPYHLIFNGFKFTTEAVEGLVLASVGNNPITIELKGSNEINVISDYYYAVGIDGSYVIDSYDAYLDLSCGINFIGDGKLKISVTNSDDAIKVNKGKVYSIGLQSPGINIGTKENKFTGEIDIESGVLRDDSLGYNIGIGITGDKKSYFNVYGGTTKVKASYAAVGFDGKSSTFTTSGVIAKGSNSVASEPSQSVEKVYIDDDEAGYLSLVDPVFGPTYYPVTNLLIKKEQTTYNVKYYNDEELWNDGEPPIDSTDYSTGQTAIIKGNIGTDDAPKMIVDGMYFDYWQDKNGTIYRPGSEVEIERDDLELYAVWKPVDFSLIYENGKLYKEKDSKLEEVKNLDGISITQSGVDNYTLNLDNLYLSTSVANGLLIKSPVKIKLNGDNYIIGAADKESIGIKIAENADVVVEGPGTLICGGLTGLESSSSVSLSKAALYAVGAPAKSSTNGVAIKFDTENKTLNVNDKYSRVVATAATAINSVTEPSVPETLVVKGTNDIDTQPIPEPKSELVDVTFDSTNKYYVIGKTLEKAQYISIGADMKTIYIVSDGEGDIGLFVDSQALVPYYEEKNKDKWSVEGNVVTFKDGFDFETAAQYAIHVLADVTINIEGNVNISNSSSERDSIVIESYDHDLNFTGTGTLNINTSVSNGAIGIDAKTINVNKTNININSYGSSTIDSIAMGIYLLRADGYINPYKINLNNATITIENKNEDNTTFYPVANSEVNLSNIATYYKDSNKKEIHASMFETKVYGKTAYTYTSNLYADKVVPTNNLVLKENATGAKYNFTIEYDGEDLYARIDSCRREIPAEIASTFGLEAYKSTASNVLVLKDFNFSTSADVGLLLTGKTNVIQLASNEPKTTDENVTNITTYSSSGKAAAVALYGDYLSILPGDNSNVYTLKLITKGEGKSSGIYIENAKDIEGNYITYPIDLDTKTKIRISLAKEGHENVYSVNPIMSGINAQYDNGSSVLVSSTQKEVAENNYTYVDSSNKIIKELVLTEATDTNASNYTLVYNMLSEGGYFSALFENGLEIPLSTVFVQDELGIRLPSKVKEKQNYDLIIDGLRGGYAGNSIITTANTGLLIKDISGSETPRDVRIFVNANAYEIQSTGVGISYAGNIVLSGDGSLVFESATGIQCNTLKVDDVDILITEATTGIKCLEDVYLDGNTVVLITTGTGVAGNNLYVGETKLMIASNTNAIYSNKIVITDNNATFDVSGNDSEKGAIVTNAIEYDDTVSKGNFFVKGAKTNAPISDNDYVEAEFDTDHFKIKEGGEEPATYVVAKSIKINLLNVTLIYTPSLSADKTTWKVYYKEIKNDSAGTIEEMLLFDSDTACEAAGGTTMADTGDGQVICACNNGQWNSSKQCVVAENDNPIELTPTQLYALGFSLSGTNNEVLTMNNSVVVTKGKIGLIVYVDETKTDGVTAPTLSINGNSTIKSTYIDSDTGATPVGPMVMQALQDAASILGGSTSSVDFNRYSSTGLLVFGTGLTIKKSNDATSTPTLTVIGNKYGVNADNQKITVDGVDASFEGADIENQSTTGLYSQQLEVTNNAKVTARGNDGAAEFYIYDEGITSPFDGNIRGSGSYDSANPSSKIEQYHDEEFGPLGNYMYYVYSNDGESEVPALSLVFEPKDTSKHKIQVISSAAGEVLPKVGGEVVYSAATGDQVILTIDEATATEGKLNGYTVKYFDGQGAEQTIDVGPDGKFTMPEYDVEVTVNFTSYEYYVEAVYDEEIGDVLFETEEPYITNQTVIFHIYVNEPDQYVIRKVAATYEDTNGSTQEITIRKSDLAYIFTIPKNIKAEGKITLAVQFKPKDSYNVTAVKPTGGDVVIRNDVGEQMSAFKEGDRVIVEYAPAEGYTTENVKVTIKDQYGNIVNGVDWGASTEFTMPGSNVTIETVYEKEQYEIDIDEEITHGQIQIVTPANSDGYYTYGQTIVFKVVPEDDNYSAETVTAINIDWEEVTVSPSTITENEYSFTMPASNVTISANIVGRTKYKININESEGGSVTVKNNITQAANGDIVGLHVEPSTGYKLKSIKYSYASEETDVSYNEEYDAYYFTMPAAITSVNAVFEKEEYSIKKVTEIYNASEEKTGEIQVVTDKVPGEDGKVKFSYGDKVTIKLVPETGFASSDKVIINDEVAIYKDENQDKTFFFNMPAYNIDDISANFIAQPKFKITVQDPGKGGSLFVDGGITEAAAGVSIIVKTPANKGYTVPKIVLKYTNASGEAKTEEIENQGGGTYSFKMPELKAETELIISTQFTASEYNIGKDVVEHGTVVIKDGPTGSEITKAKVGEKVYVQVTPETDYAIQELLVKVATCYHYSEDTYVFTMPAGDVNVTAKFDAVPKNKIILVDPGNEVGTIAAKKEDVSVVEATMNSIINLSYTTKAGYEFNSWEVKDSDGNTITVDHDQFIMPDKQVTVKGIFNKISYNIETSESRYGSIAVKNSEYAGETVSITVTPNESYKLTSLSIVTTASGNAVPFYYNSTTKKYDFIMPTEGVTITPTFAENSNSISIDDHEAGGKISADAISAVAGTTIHLSIANIPEGYLFKKWVVRSGTSPISVTDATTATGASFVMPNNPVVVTCEYTKQTTITFEKGEGATGGDNTVIATKGFTLPAINIPTKTGYTFLGYYASQDENATQYYSSSGSSSIQWASEQPEATLYAHWQKTNYSINQDENINKTNGEVKTLFGGEAVSSATYGDVITLQIIPAEGKILKKNSLKVLDSNSNEVTITADNTFEMPASNVTIQYEFEDDLNYYGVTVTDVGAGSTKISGDTEKTAQYNTNITVTTSPNPGSILSKLTVDGVDVQVVAGVYTFKMPTHDVIIKATYIKDTNDYTITIPSFTNGKVESDKSTAKSTNEVTLTVTPDAGYRLNTIELSTGTTLNIEEKGKTYKFLMPSSNVTVAATFVEDVKRTLVFDSKGGTVVSSRQVSVGEEYGELETPTKTGAKFNGWWLTEEDETDTTKRISAKTVMAAGEGNVTVYAHWSTNADATITFDGNGGTPTSQELKMPYGSKLGEFATQTANLSRTGYTFKHWSVKGEQEEYDHNATLPQKGITLVAQWTPINYTIKFDGNSATSGEMSDISMTYDKAQALTSNVFVKTGHHFVEWKDLTTNLVYDDGVEVNNLTAKANSNVTLQAQWAANTFKVEYIANTDGTSGTMSVSNHTYGTASTLTENVFTKPGYHFTGWTTKSDGSGVKFTDKQDMTNYITSDKNTIKLYAQWEPNKYTINYDGNGATSGSTASSTHTYSKSEKITPNGFKKTGYYFSNWKYNGSYYNDSVNVNNLTTGTDPITFVAQWLPITYTVVYNSNGATGGTSMSSVLHTYDVDKNLSYNSYTKTGYTFAGWKDAAGTTYANGESVKNLSDTMGGIVTLTAQWTPVTGIVVTLNDGAGSGGQGSTSATYLSEMTKLTQLPTRTGYKFGGYQDTNGTKYFDESGNCVKAWDKTSTATLSAIWTPITYTIKFSAGEGTGTMNPITLTYDSNTGRLPICSLTKAGYKFVDWTGSDGNHYIDNQLVKNLTSVDGAEITLTANWTPITYTVSLNGNGGSGATTTKINIANNAQFVNLTGNMPTREGYTFKGYYDTNTLTQSSVQYFDETGKVVGSATWSKAGDGTLYALWEGVVHTKPTVPTQPVHGTVSFDESQEYKTGKEIKITITPDTGYKIKEVKGTYGTDDQKLITILNKNGTRSFIMPNADNVKVTVTFEVDTNVKFNVSYDTFAHGNVTASKTNIPAETANSLNVVPDTGYQLKADTLKVINNTTSQEVTLTDKAFTMPNSDVTVKAEFEPNQDIKQSIIKGSLVNGAITAITDKNDNNITETYVENEVILTVEPDAGYKLDTITATYSDGKSTKTITPTLVAGTTNKYSFGMPAYKVTVNATFAVDKLTTKEVSIKTGMTNGVVELKESAKTNYYVTEEVPLLVKPAEGYRVDTITATYTGKAGTQTITPKFVEKTKDGLIYTFSMPGYATEVDATFAKQEATSYYATRATADDGYSIKEVYMSMKNSSSPQTSTTTILEMRGNPSNAYTTIIENQIKITQPTEVGQDVISVDVVANPNDPNQPKQIKITAKHTTEVTSESGEITHYPAIVEVPIKNINNEPIYKVTFKVYVTSEVETSSEDYIKGSSQLPTQATDDELSEFLETPSDPVDSDVAAGCYVRIDKDEQEAELTKSTSTVDGDYTVKEGSVRITLLPKILDTLDVGEHILYVRTKTGLHEIHFFVKSAPSPGPGPSPSPGKDESCEKVIGPTWHWNNDKGVCEETGVVHTYSR